MTDPIPLQKPAPPPAVRWSVLAFISLAMFGNYYIYDSIAPIANLLEAQIDFSSTQLGVLNAIYSFPNIIMVLLGGILVDRLGTRKSTFVFTAICLVGALVTAFATNVESLSDGGFSTFHVMAAGRLIFGLGAESMIVAITAALGQWFKGKQLGLAFGVNLAIARAGSYAADLSPTWARGVYEAGWQGPLLIAAAFGLMSLVAAGIYWMLESRAEMRYDLHRAAPADKIVWADLFRFDRSYWYIVGLTVTFYSVIFPFRSTFAIKYFEDAHGLDLAAAGQMNSYVFLAAIFATPFFGFLVDRVAKRSLFMTLGSLLLFPVFIILGYTDWNLWITTAMLGVSFSLVPAVLWPSVAYLVGENRLGTAYGLMTMVQNIGLTIFNLAAGWLNDTNGAGADNPDGYLPMLWMFGLLSLGGLVFSALLRKRENGPHGHGLETIKASGL